MSVGTVRVERRGHILLMGLDRAAKRNAFDLPLDRDPELRVGVLHALGDHFTGGLDLPQWSTAFSSGKWQIVEDGLDPLGMTGPRVKKPVIVAVQGTCLTIGIELMLACDVRIAAPNARFGQIEVKRGIYPVGGATLRFPREVGWGNAMRWLLTGDEFDAAEAYRIGLVQEVVPLGEQVKRAVALAERIAEQAPLGVQATLASAHLAVREGERAAADQLVPDLLPLFGTEDGQEGVRSFLERRKAVFQGR
jgi:enoyl-CoA hydratase